MALRTSADFLFGIEQVKVIPLNADLSTPLPLTGGTGNAQDARGGIGPFDFSGVVAIAAVEFKIKIDNAEDAVTTIDLSAAVSQSAVTAAEVVAAITAAGYTNITAAVVNSRVDISLTVPGTKRYLQVYGEGAEIAEFGQGLGLQFIRVNTQQSFAKTPTLKDSETITITDSNGLDTEVITDSYRKGLTGVIVDTALDYELKQLLEGGTYDTTNDFYANPTSESTKKYFAIEVVRAIYSKGQNKVGEKIGYILERIYTCVADPGDDAGDRNWTVQNYNITATSYKDPVTSTIYPDMTEQKFTIAAYTALDWENI